MFILKFLYDQSIVKTKKLYPCDMAFSLGIVTNVKIWYNTGMKSKEWWALGNAPPERKKTNYEKSITNRKILQKIKNH